MPLLMQIIIKCERKVKIHLNLQLVVDFYTNRNYTIGVLKGEVHICLSPLIIFLLFLGLEVLKMATVKKISKKKKIIIAVAVVLVIAILSTVIGVAVSANQKTAVTLNTIGTGEINETVSATGTVSAGTTKEYKVGAVATVKEVFVQTGDQVKEGDLLATFDTSSLDSQISELSSTYNQARNSYRQSVNDQKTAKANLSEVDSLISDLEKTVQKLGGETAYTTERPNITRPTTEPTTEETTTTTTTTTTTQPEDTSASDTTSTTESVTYPPTIEGAMDALTDLVETITSLSDDVQQTNEMVRVVMEQIAAELESGNYAPEKIAEEVGKAVSDAIQQGIIDETKLIIESGVAVDMIESAVAGIDWSAIGQSIVGDSSVQLAAAELRLTALYAQKQIYELAASDTTVYAKKQIMDTAGSALDSVKEAGAELEAGWTAAFDGTITACDIYPGEMTSMLSSGITLENLDRMVVTLSLGEYDIHKVKVGMPATITSAYGTYTGEVLSKAPTATGGSEGSFLDSVGSMAGISGLSSLTSTGAGVEVQVSVDNADENIIIGFDADVEIQVGDYKNITVVPIESIVLEKTGTYVYLYNAEEGSVTKTLIETGAVSDSVYQVTSGLNVGDQIVATPSSDYEEDTFDVRVTTE